MRLILEKNEIVTILGKHFEANLDPDKVIIRTDPFEIEVCELPLTDAPPPKDDENVVPLAPRRASVSPRNEEPVKRRADDNASTEPPPPGDDGTGTGANPDISPAAMLAASKQLEMELARENPQARRSGSYTHEPPAFSKDEIS